MKRHPRYARATVRRACLEPASRVLRAACRVLLP